MMMLAFLAILCVCQSGCFRWTERIWKDTHIHENPSAVNSVHMSAEGDLCVIYTASSPPPRKDLSRALVLMHDDLRRLVNDAEERSVPATLREALAPHVLPSDITEPTFDQSRVSQIISGWREIPVVHRDLSERDQTKSYEERELLWEKLQLEARAARTACTNGRGQVEIPYSAAGRVLLTLPHRSQPSTWKYVSRILLTPPAVALDIAEPAVVCTVVVVTSPVWVPLVICYAHRQSNR